MKKYKICLTGVSGIGKSSIIKVLMEEYGFRFSVSTTTRDARPGEEDGVHYTFVSKDEFVKMISQDLFIEHTVYAGNYYGTPVEQVVKAKGHLVLDLDPEVSTFDRIELKDVVKILLVHDDKEVIKARLKARFAEGDSSDTLHARLDQIENRIYDHNAYDFVVNVTDKTSVEIAREMMELLNDV